MLDTSRRAEAMTDRTKPLVVVSGDSHVGPKLEDMRQYCPRSHRDLYDEYIAGHRSQPPRGGLGVGGRPDTTEAKAFMEIFARNLATAGHHDMHARLHDMDEDGIASQVIFHTSLNGEPLPFRDPGLGSTLARDDGVDLETAAIGQHMYNQWLADVCSIEPERHVGLAYLPMWDVSAAVAELEWARDAGLRGVNFPVPRGGIPHYDDPVWEPFWSACEHAGMPLCSHSGGGNLADYTTPHGFSVLEVEAGGWLARRALPRLVFGGVFERHPALHLVLTEQNGDWWTDTCREYDSSYKTHRWQYPGQLSRTPSEYLRSNVYIGASFMAPFEAQRAVKDGYWTNTIWGSDYPHPEGTYQHRANLDDPNPSRLSMRYCFAEIPSEYVPAMVGGNGLDAYDLDAAALEKVAERIGAPTLEELATPIDGVPDNGGVQAFRTIGPWG
jgi:predicted TIM-barrel fold metal-dependent hydrolase